GKAGYPFALVFGNPKPSIDLAAALYQVKRGADGLSVEFEYSSGKVTSKKTFSFSQNTYLTQLTSDVTENGAPAPHQIAWRGGFGDLAVAAPDAAQHSIYYDLGESKLIIKQAKDAKDAPVTASGTFSFAGVEYLYFAAVYLPSGNGASQGQTFSDSVLTPFQKEEAAFAGAAVGGEGRNRFSLYVGPKDIDVLQTVNPRLAQVVDWGWFGFLAKPLFLLVRWTDERYIHNYGWTIIVVTIFINFAMFPLKLSSLKSMKKMQAIQPQIKSLQDKYKSLSMKDPKRQEQNQEMMQLYTKHGVNPLGGCIPMLLQMPFLIAFYTVFTVAIEMRGAGWLWVADLSQAETIPIRILPIIMTASQFIMQKMTPATGTDPNQQKMMLLMPLVFGFMFYGAASGLMLYWLTGNLVAIGQQWFFNRTTPSPAPEVSSQGKKKSGKK
ncbi:MAG: membrane protein insertase YidC, partial [Bryobacteraceae bacterium]